MEQQSCERRLTKPGLCRVENGETEEAGFTQTYKIKDIVYNLVLVIARIEVIFFVVAVLGLCFGFVLDIGLII